jgi:hypothetical protein
MVRFMIAPLRCGYRDRPCVDRAELVATREGSRRLLLAEFLGYTAGTGGASVVTRFDAPGAAPLPASAAGIGGEEGDAAFAGDLIAEALASTSGLPDGPGLLQEATASNHAGDTYTVYLAVRPEGPGGAAPGPNNAGARVLAVLIEY